MSVLLIFKSTDNGARDGDDVQKTARGMLLALNTDAMTVNLTQEWLPSFDNVSESQGNVDVRPRARCYRAIAEQTRSTLSVATCSSDGAKSRTRANTR